MSDFLRNFTDGWIQRGYEASIIRGVPAQLAKIHQSFFPTNRGTYMFVSNANTVWAELTEEQILGDWRINYKVEHKKLDTKRWRKLQRELRDRYGIYWMPIGMEPIPEKFHFRGAVDVPAVVYTTVNGQYLSDGNPARQMTLIVPGSPETLSDMNENKMTFTYHAETPVWPSNSINGIEWFRNGKWTLRGPTYTFEKGDQEWKRSYLHYTGKWPTPLQF